MAESTSEVKKTSYHDLGIRLQALILLESNTPIKTITEITGITERSIYRLCTTAKKRGYDPNKSKKLILAYIEDT